MSDDWTMDGKNHPPARMDFIMEDVVFDDEHRSVRFALIPDPRRYEETEIDGEAHYVDRFLRHAIPRQVMHTAMVEQARGLPIFASPATIESASDYATARKSALDEERSSGEYVAPKEIAKAQGELVANRRRALSFLSVDIQGSSAMRQANPSAFDRAFELFIRELGTVVGQFHGDILKTTGDGFIAYLDYPGFTLQCDNTLDLGLSLIRVLETAINPTLAADGMPELVIRVGADFGLASIKVLSIPPTGYRSVDIASDALNRSVKIEQSASANELRIGRALYELVHVKWLERCALVNFDGTKVGEEGYCVYCVT